MKIKYRILQFVFLLILVSGAIIFTTIKLSQESRENVYNGVSTGLRDLQQLSISELQKAKEVADEGIIDASGLVTIDRVTNITLANQKNYNTIVNAEIEKASKDIAETLEAQQAAVNLGLDQFLGEATDALSKIITHDNKSFAIIANAAVNNIDYLQAANSDGLQRFKDLQNKFIVEQQKVTDRNNEDIDRLLISILVTNQQTGLSQVESELYIKQFEDLKHKIHERNDNHFKELFLQLDQQKNILTEEARIIAKNVKWAINSEKEYSDISQSEQTSQIIANLLITQENINDRTSASAEKVSSTIINLKKELPKILQEKGSITNAIIFDQINAAKKDTASAQVLVGQRIENNTQKAIKVFESAIDESQHVIDSSLDASLKKTTRLSLFIAIGCGILSLFLGYMMIKSISNPISKVLHFAEKLSKGDLKERLPEGHDEMGEMSKALNIMADELADLQQATIDGFNQTLDQVIDCVFIFDPTTLQFIYVNQGAVDHLGYSREELLSKTPIDIKPEFTEEEFRKILVPLISAEQESHHFQTVHRLKDGSIVPVEILLKYATPPRNTPRMVAIVRDITDRIRQQKETESIQSQLLHKQKLESVGQLAAGLSHEINTPTQFISTNIEFLSETFDEISAFITDLGESSRSWPDEVQKEIKDTLEELDWEYLEKETPTALSQSKEGVNRVISLVSAMKRFSHPGSTEMVSSNLHEIIDTALTVSRNEWKYLAEVTTEYDEKIPLIPLLVDEMGQVILNIVVNSAHAIAERFGETTETGNQGKISIITKYLNDQVIIQIKDNGNGIPQDFIDKVFDPFFTTKTVGKGTGQGLAISHDVITKKHNGQLEVESEQGVGTFFTIHLPVSIDSLS